MSTATILQQKEVPGRSSLTPASSRSATCPISVIVPVRNEARNLSRCLESLSGVGEVFVIDSGSGDETANIARARGAEVVQFHYRGGWPKKRQWALDTLAFAYDWVLLLDADESLTPELKSEIEQAIQDPAIDGYFIKLEMYFLGRQLRYCGANFSKLSLFRPGTGSFECRLRDQTTSMCDMEVHEHVMVRGKTAHLRNPILHFNVESLSRYIEKHNEYSNWEARVWLEGDTGEQIEASLTGTQAQRRRWLRKKFLRLPGIPFLFFLYKYVLRFGFLDGVPGMIYCAMQGIQFFNIKAKIYELEQAACSARQTS
ncbi:MAG TPA: glycosyltransferase family 2 protein [Terriglobales bacterium]